jgi:hypothetical protein
MRLHKNEGSSTTPKRISLRRKRRRWSGPRRDISEYLKDMADLGFVLEQSKASREIVGPCPF